CPEDTEWVDHNRDGLLDDDECVEQSTTECPDGSVWEDRTQSCVVIAPTEEPTHEPTEEPVECPTPDDRPIILWKQSDADECSQPTEEPPTEEPATEEPATEEPTAECPDDMECLDPDGEEIIPSDDEETPVPGGPLSEI